MTIIFFVECNWNAQDRSHITFSRSTFYSNLRRLCRSKADIRHSLANSRHLATEKADGVSIELLCSCSEQLYYGYKWKYNVYRIKCLATV